MRPLWLLLLLSACSVDGVVLIVREQGDASALADAGGGGDVDAAGEPNEASIADAQPFDAQASDARQADAQPAATGTCRIRGAEDGFFESFPNLDPARWLVAQGSTSLAGNAVQFAPGNVAIEGGALVLRVDANGAAAIATRDLFASGTYQVQGRVGAGLELAVWWRRDSESDGTIDIATPGLDGSQLSYARVRMRRNDGTAAGEDQFALAASLDDGADHGLRFDRYTTATPGLRFWVDDELRLNIADHLPTSRAGRMWIVASAPPGTSGVVRITNAFITPFGNDGDRCQDDELAGPGLVPP